AVDGDGPCDVARLSRNDLGLALSAVLRGVARAEADGRRQAVRAEVRRAVDAVQASGPTKDHSVHLLSAWPALSLAHTTALYDVCAAAARGELEGTRRMRLHRSLDECARTSPRSFR